MTDFDLSQIDTAISDNQKVVKRDFKKYIRYILILIVLIALSFGTYFVYSLKYRNRPNDITIGYSQKEDLLLLSLAEHMNFEVSEKELDIREFDNDEDMLQSMKDKKLDLVIIEDISFALTDPNVADLRIISEVASTERYYFLVDIKKGIFDLTHMIDRSLGIIDSYKTDYWLNVVLSNSGMNEKQLNSIPLKPNKLAQEFADANVDGIFAWQPYIYQTENFEGSEIQVLKIPAQSVTKSYIYLIASQEYIDSNPDDIKDVLMSMQKAEEYLNTNQDDVIEYLLGEWSTERSYVTEILSDTSYGIGISSDAKISLKRQYDWGNKKSRLSDTDYRIENAYFYDILKEINPNIVEF